ncbi:hypothetical protein HBH98_184170 [Parastagonospora nodorum]|nr:hypothetical protein HBH53_183760 [Parastagonospora nodorum]KAH3964096.1 hypothetical protein HBH51_162070 [Parastagonospora nodorum]KAH3997639.1 hypothetical protein HBI10_142970 [Parastagonospora nodorum]KAH4021086.1 hypothetical protein HBI13_111270 [Parastagonospora nodorum]KAH4037131.1 hypothetical protein HBI09_066400 [Parastagonospora nodorum]
MRPDVILKSFEATGVWPMEADAVLKRFNDHLERQDEDSEVRDNGDGDSGNKLRKFLDAAVADKAKVEAKRLSKSIHLLQVNDDFLHDQNAGLQEELNAKKSRSQVAVPSIFNSSKSIISLHFVTI